MMCERIKVIEQLKRSSNDFCSSNQSSPGACHTHVHKQTTSDCTIKLANNLIWLDFCEKRFLPPPARVQFDRLASNVCNQQLALARGRCGRNRRPKTDPWLITRSVSSLNLIYKISNLTKSKSSFNGVNNNCWSFELFPQSSSQTTPSNYFL